MDYIVLSGVKPYDGRYELNLTQEFTTREWGWIKRLAGYLPVTLTDDAFSDPELACALAVIVLHRAGRIEKPEAAAMFDRLVDAPFGSTITIETDDASADEAGDAGPPAPSSSGNGSSSGESSKTSSETSLLPPAVSGIPDSGSLLSRPGTESET